MSEAPKDIWINWKAANAADLAYDEPPITQWDDVSQHYRRADLCADPALLAEAKSMMTSLIAMIQHAIGPGKDVFIEPDTGRKLSDATALVAKLENRHDR